MKFPNYHQIVLDVWFFGPFKNKLNAWKTRTIAPQENMSEKRHKTILETIKIMHSINSSLIKRSWKKSIYIEENTIDFLLNH